MGLFGPYTDFPTRGRSQIYYFHGADLDTLAFNFTAWEVDKASHSFDSLLIQTSPIEIIWNGSEFIVLVEYYNPETVASIDTEPPSVISTVASIRTRVSLKFFTGTTVDEVVAAYNAFEPTQPNFVQVRPFKFLFTGSVYVAGALYYYQEMYTDISLQTAGGGL